MEDLASTINQILGSQEGMNQLKTIADALGLDMNNTNFGGGNGTNIAMPPQNQPQMDNPLGALSGLFGGGNSPQTPQNTQPISDNPFAALSGLFGGGSTQTSSQNSIPNIDPAMIFKLQSVFSLMNKEDQNTALLRALKPHMSEERQKKIDDAIRMMQLVRMLPLIKEMGLFGGDNK